MSLATLRTEWQALPLRRRRVVAAALTLLAAAVLWWVALAPALTTLRTAPTQRLALDAQLQRMRQLEAQARAIRASAQALPPLGRDEAQQALETTVRQQFGEAGRLTAQADGMTLVLTGVSGQALAQWLAQARIEARTLPREARLNRQASGLWEGRLTLMLPPASTPR